MDGYGAVIDRHALASVLETDSREAAEWLTPGILWRIALMGGLPAALLAWARIDWKAFWPELVSRIVLLLACVALAAVAVAAQGRQIASFVRNNDQVKHLANPYAVLAASLSYADHARNDGQPIQAIGMDAHHGHPVATNARPLVIVLAIGESARASSFALGGYPRQTNPELAKLPIVYFGNVTSCGTNTATSLPCMFSDLGRAGYGDARARQRQNLLDVMAHAGFDVLWLTTTPAASGLPCVRARPTTSTPPIRASATATAAGTMCCWTRCKRNCPAFAAIR